MTVFLLLLTIFALLHLLSVLGLKTLKDHKTKGRIAMGIMFTIAGLLHFIATDRYLLMMPPFLPFHLELVYLSGVLEMLGGIGLLIPRLQRLAAYGLIALLIAVFPANIYVAMENIQLGGYMSLPLYQWSRLPMQLVLIWWALWSTKKDESQSVRRELSAV